MNLLISTALQSSPMTSIFFFYLELMHLRMYVGDAIQTQSYIYGVYRLEDKEVQLCRSFFFCLYITRFVNVVSPFSCSLLMLSASANYIHNNNANPVIHYCFLRTTDEHWTHLSPFIPTAWRTTMHLLLFQEALCSLGSSHRIVWWRKTVLVSRSIEQSW